MAIEYRPQAVGGPVLVFCLSSDTKPDGQATTWVLWETDTGNQFRWNGASWTAVSSGTNTGDQTSIVGITGTIAQFNTAITDGDLATGGGTATGANTGDNATNTQYSGLAASKQDTLVSGTNIKTVNGTTLLGSGDLVVVAADFSSVLTATSTIAANTQRILNRLLINDGGGVLAIVDTGLLVMN